MGCLAFHTSTWLPHGNVETHVSRGAHPHQCPCYYPGNYASNKRWCCGDMYHLDLSVWAFEKLAQTKWGVIGVEWRDVPCWCGGGGLGRGAAAWAAGGGGGKALNPACGSSPGRPRPGAVRLALKP